MQGGGWVQIHCDGALFAELQVDSWHSQTKQIQLLFRGFCCEDPWGELVGLPQLPWPEDRQGGLLEVSRGSMVSTGGPGGLQVYVVAHVGDVDQACLDVCHIFLCYKIRYHLVWATHLLLSSTQVHTRWSAGESPAAHE